MDNSNSTINNTVLIKKASGDEEVFLSEKLKLSLVNAGAKKETIEKIVRDIENWIYNGVTTRKIYSRAFAMLRKEKSTSSLRYSLKKAILELGPTGYPFESLVGRLFELMGFKTEVGIVLDGKCVTHEMDVIATNDSEQHLVECKYHKDQGKQVSVQVPLYVRSRVNDIIDNRAQQIVYKNLTFTGWVITNTRFSLDSIKYGTCSGLNLLAWNYPVGNGLQQKLEEYKIFPITVLKNLTIKEKQTLLKGNIVTCTQLLDNLGSLNSLNLTNAKHKLVIKELKKICN
jgi:hypothetical protein